jgi:hypothetical protein
MDEARSCGTSGDDILIKGFPSSCRMSDQTRLSIEEQQQLRPWKSLNLNAYELQSTNLRSEIAKPKASL